MPSLGRRRPRAPAPFAYSSIEDHVPTVVGKYMLEIEVLSWLGTRHNEDKVCHNLPPLDSRDDRGPTWGLAVVRRKLSGQKTPRPGRRKADTRNCERAE